MSNPARVGLIVLAVAVVAIAFVTLRPTDSSDNQDEPAPSAGQTTVTEPEDDARDGGPTATAKSAPPPPQEVTLRDGVPRGGIKRIVVKKGEDVRLQVRTNEDGDDIHLHGYDIEKEAKAGAPANFRFKADIEGIFEIESHTAEDAGREPLVARLVVEPS